MELALRSVGERVLCLTNGAFSRRFAEIAEALGKRVVRLDAPGGAPADLAGARALLDSGQSFDAITVCASETSTGSLTAPAAIGAALGERGEARLLVDVVTLLGAGPVEVSAHGIDFALAGTQKALALPPGLGLFAVSKAMLENATPSGSYFLDLVRMVDAHAARKPPMTPTIPLYRALRLQLETIADGALERVLIAGVQAPEGASGLELRFHRHGAMRARTRAFALRAGLSVFGESTDARQTSPAVTNVDLGGRAGAPSPVDLLEMLRSRGFQIGGGYGPLARRCVRIGHMGDHSVSALDSLLEAFGHALERAE